MYTPWNGIGYSYCCFMDVDGRYHDVSNLFQTSPGIALRVHILHERYAQNWQCRFNMFEYVSIKGIVDVKFAWNKTRWTPGRLGSQPGGQWSCKGLIKLQFAGLHYIDISGLNPQWPCSWVSRWCVLTRQRLKVLTGRLVRTEFKYG